MDEVFRYTVAEEIEMGVRLVIAAALGLLVGFERERADKPAGLRTIALVSVGAAAFTAASSFGFIGGDPTRIASGVVAGVGFLGAGAILRSGGTVIGMTTAASIWAIAAIGVLVGAGMYILSAVATVLVLIILHLVPRPKA